MTMTHQLSYNSNSNSHSNDCCDATRTSSDEFIGLKACESHGSLDKSDADKVARYVVKNFNKLVRSQEFRKLQQSSGTPAHDEIVQLKHSQLELGRLLGEGSFSDVFEIKKSLSDDIPTERFVVKVLRKKLIDEPTMFAASAVGLATEGAILASLNHKNIIRIRGCSENGVSTYATGRNDAFFIVLDQLEEMLNHRLEQWSHRAEHLRFCMRRRHQKVADFFCQRLEVAVQLSDAVSFLHEHRIIHRDLKPTNVGFDFEGTVKLFDFDVSKILPDASTDNEDERFNLTATTGTRRYMSPECGLGETYNCKTDVYSFAILLHEILSLQKPFQGVSKVEHKYKVFRVGLRPWIHASWPRGIKLLLKQAWSSEVESRPNMLNVHESLTHELCELQKLQKRSQVPAIRFGRRSPFKVSAIEARINQ